MTGVLPWLVRCTRRACTTDFGPACAALVNQLQNIIFFNVPFFILLVPIAQQPGQAGGLGLLSLSFWDYPCSLLKSVTLCPAMVLPVCFKFSFVGSGDPRAIGLTFSLALHKCMCEYIYLFFSHLQSKFAICLNVQTCVISTTLLSSQ